MNSGTPESLAAQPKALVFWRTNYLMGVARPSALVFDGSTVTCLDNELAPVFSAAPPSLTMTKGFGIFRVFVDGERIGYLTPVGGSTSPAPSAALQQFLAQTPTGTEGALGTAVSVGSAIGGSDVADILSTITYAQGMKSLSAYLTAVGVLQRK
jgi:hypothetical protein